MTETSGSDTQGDPQAHLKSNAARINELNETQRFTMWSVFRLARPLGEDDVTRKAETAELGAFFDDLATRDVLVRGIYDVAGLRADADVMIWWHATTSDELQEAYHALRRTAFGTRLVPGWSQMAMHRRAEFNRSYLSAFLADERAHACVAVYPVVRS